MNECLLGHHQIFLRLFPFFCLQGLKNVKNIFITLVLCCSNVCLKSSDHVEQCCMMRETHVLVTSIHAEKLYSLQIYVNVKLICLVALEFWHAGT